MYIKLREDDRINLMAKNAMARTLLSSKSRTKVQMHLCVVETYVESQSAVNARLRSQNIGLREN